MTDSNKNKIEIGDLVQHRKQPKYPIGIVEKIEDGCNAVCWVDFNHLVSNKKHLTICCKDDIIKQNHV